MAYWIIAATFSGLLGFWVAARYKVDGPAGFLLGLAFSTLFGTGLCEKIGRYESAVQWALTAFGLLICLTFLLLQDRGTSIALSKIGGLTFLVSVLFYIVAPSEIGLHRAENSLVQVADAATVPVSGLGSVLGRTAMETVDFSARFPGQGGSTLAQTRRNTRIYELKDGRSRPSSELVPSGKWTVVKSEARDTPQGRFIEIELRPTGESSEEKMVVGFVSESDIGAKITLPDEN